MQKWMQTIAHKKRGMPNSHIELGDIFQYVPESDALCVHSRIPHTRMVFDIKNPENPSLPWVVINENVEVKDGKIAELLKAGAMVGGKAALLMALQLEVSTFNVFTNADYVKLDEWFMFRGHFPADFASLNSFQICPYPVLSYVPQRPRSYGFVEPPYMDVPQICAQSNRIWSTGPTQTRMKNAYLGDFPSYFRSSNTLFRTRTVETHVAFQSQLKTPIVVPAGSVVGDNTFGDARYNVIYTNHPFDVVRQALDISVAKTVVRWNEITQKFEALSLYPKDIEQRRMRLAFHAGLVPTAYFASSIVGRVRSYESLGFVEYYGSSMTLRAQYIVTVGHFNLIVRGWEIRDRQMSWIFSLLEYHEFTKHVDGRSAKTSYTGVLEGEGEERHVVAPHDVSDDFFRRKYLTHFSKPLEDWEASSLAVFVDMARLLEVERDAKIKIGDRPFGRGTFLFEMNIWDYVVWGRTDVFRRVIMASTPKDGGAPLFVMRVTIDGKICVNRATIKHDIMLGPCQLVASEIDWTPFQSVMYDFKRIQSYADRLFGTDHRTGWKSLLTSESWFERTAESMIPVADYSETSQVWNLILPLVRQVSSYYTWFRERKGPEWDVFCKEPTTLRTVEALVSGVLDCIKIGVVRFDRNCKLHLERGGARIAFSSARLGIPTAIPGPLAVGLQSQSVPLPLPVKTFRPITSLCAVSDAPKRCIVAGVFAIETSGSIRAGFGTLLYLPPGPAGPDGPAFPAECVLLDDIEYHNIQFPGYKTDGVGSVITSDTRFDANRVAYGGNPIFSIVGDTDVILRNWAMRFRALEQSDRGAQVCKICGKNDAAVGYVDACPNSVHLMCFQREVVKLFTRGTNEVGCPICLHRPHMIERNAMIPRPSDTSRPPPYFGPFEHRHVGTYMGESFR